MLTRSYTVLAVDYPDYTALLALLLKDCVVREAAKMTQALRIARTRAVDLYLLDDWLPDGSGIELCREIRRFDTNTPILSLSDHVSGQQMCAVGATAYLLKNCAPAMLIGTVSALLHQQARRNDEARRIEEDAIRAEIAQRARRLRERDIELQQRVQQLAAATQASAGRAMHARSLRQKALHLYSTTGGSRGAFVRDWRDVRRAIGARDVR